jgi:thiol-disulfide isomerase/thioredoxin
MLTDNAYNLKPGGYALQVMNEWKAGVKKLEDFKTSDNIKPREDFVAIQKKLLATKLLDLTDHYYPRVHAVYYPNEKLKYPKSIEGLRKEVRLSDSSLASFPQFRSYLAASVRTRSNRNDSLYLAALSGMPGGVTKDYMIYEAVQNEVFRVKDSTKRARLFRQGIASISAPRLQAALRAKEASVQRIGRGRKAPNFSAEAINEASFDLTKLANRFVVIDVWATWCVPCIKEAPFFEELADKYTSEQVAFVSVSIDENKNAWRMAAAGNKARVLQLWAKNADQDFTRAFAINTIPRYLLIDPKGQIVDADLPPPSDPNFEATLLREISFLSNRSF